MVIFAKKHIAMKRLLLITTMLMLCGAGLRAQVPPVGEAKIVAEYCLHCKLINYEKGETHRSDCPYAHGDSGSSSSSGSKSSHSSTPIIDPALTSAIQSMSYAAGEALGAALDQSIDNFYAGSMVQYDAIRPGDQNGPNVVGRNGKNGSVGVFSNDTRWWKIGPIYQDLKIFDMSAIIAMNKHKRVGVLDASGKRTQKIVPFEYDAFQVLGQRNSKGLVYALGVKNGDKMVWSIWNGNSRLIVDEFDDVRITDEGIVAERGDRYQVFDLEGQLKQILVQRR